MERRLEIIARAWPKPTCPVCHGHPSRLVAVAPDTGKQLSETMPADGCPRWARPVKREIVLVDDLEVSEP